jgi:SAM-dependent methyltransferase
VRRVEFTTGLRPVRFLPSRFALRISTLLVVLVPALPATGWAQTPDSTEPSTYRYQTQNGEAAPYVSSPRPVVDSMLSLAGVEEDDIVYDLGSGDGRIPILAAQKYGARGVGIEIKQRLVDSARSRARRARVADRVEFRQGDLFEADISDATVVTLYLLPSVNLKLRPKLFRELAPGTRVVSHDFHMEEWIPEETAEFGDKLLYLWRIPEEPPNFGEQER